jgi:hypothetical protein
MRMVHEYYTSSAGQFDFLVHYLNETPARGKFISNIYHHPCMAVLELLRGKCPPYSLLCSTHYYHSYLTHSLLSAILLSIPFPFLPILSITLSPTLLPYLSFFSIPSQPKSLPHFHSRRSRHQPPPR